jgi:hypothetical protein
MRTIPGIRAVRSICRNVRMTTGSLTGPPSPTEYRGSATTPIFIN